MDFPTSHRERVHLEKANGKRETMQKEALLYRRDGAAPGKLDMEAGFWYVYLGTVPVREGDVQHLVLMEKTPEWTTSKVICTVLYVYLQNRYGA
jgi:hypothetical protein